MENCVNEAKTQYQESLQNLERISNEIHQQRKSRREGGDRVGEEQTDSYTEFVIEFGFVLFEFFWIYII